MTFTAVLDGRMADRETETYYSIGGGFITQEGQGAEGSQAVKLPMPIQSSADLLRYCHESAMTIPEVVRTNERTWRSDTEIREGLLRHLVRTRCRALRLPHGCHIEGTLPGGLNVVRRAAAMDRKLLQGDRSYPDVETWMDAIRRVPLVLRDAQVGQRFRARGE